VSPSQRRCAEAFACMVWALIDVLYAADSGAVLGLLKDSRTLQETAWESGGSATPLAWQGKGEETQGLRYAAGSPTRWQGFALAQSCMHCIHVISNHVWLEPAAASGNSYDRTVAGAQHVRSIPSTCRHFAFHQPRCNEPAMQGCQCRLTVLSCMHLMGRTHACTTPHNRRTSKPSPALSHSCIVDMHPLRPMQVPHGARY
jgi:hypothetical protein